MQNFFLGWPHLHWNIVWIQGIFDWDSIFVNPGHAIDFHVDIVNAVSSYDIPQWSMKSLGR